MHVEIVYATPAAQEVIEIELAEGATVRDAVVASGLLRRFPEINLETATVGIYGERAALDDPLQQRDRVEIYRALLADPKEARRRRARKKS